MRNAVYGAAMMVLWLGLQGVGQVVTFQVEVQPAEAEKAAEKKADEKADGEKDKKPEPAKPEGKKKAKEGFKAVEEKKGARANRVPARRLIAPAQGVLAVAVQQDAMIQQWRQQLQPLFLAELNFVRQVCELTEEQRPKIRAAGEKSLQEAAEQFVKSQQRGNVVEPDQLSSTTTIQRGLTKALEETLPPEQFARYKTELDARTAQRKRAAILSIVSRLEEALSLTVDQREKVAAEMNTQWKEAWEQWLVVNRYGDQYFPQIPDKVLLPHLDDAQRNLWNDLAKIAIGSFVGVMAQPVDDAEWWGKPDAPPVGPPDSVDAAAINGAVEVQVEGEAAAPAALGEVFMQVLSKLFTGGQK